MWLVGGWWRAAELSECEGGGGKSFVSRYSRSKQLLTKHRQALDVVAKVAGLGGCNARGLEL